jgi:DNA-binding MarR family transcriptional regulator
MPDLLAPRVDVIPGARNITYLNPNQIILVEPVGTSSKVAKFCLTYQTMCSTFPPMVHTMDTQTRRLLDAYPAIYLACHRQHVRDDERGNAVTAHQASILDHLDATRPMILSKLAEHMGVSRSTMSITVARLVRDGYITRKRNQKDARSVGLTLTRAGTRIKEQNTVLDPDVLKQIFRLIPANELETALQGIERLAKGARIILQRRKRAHDK